MKKIIQITLLILTLIFFSGCTQTVQEIKQEENVGTIVSVKGTVEDSIKLGELSAYSLIDKNNDKIIIASKMIPENGEKITAKGTLNKVPFFGYYIDTNKK